MSHTGCSGQQYEGFSVLSTPGHVSSLVTFILQGAPLSILSELGKQNRAHTGSHSLQGLYPVLYFTVSSVLGLTHEQL